MVFFLYCTFLKYRSSKYRNSNDFRSLEAINSHFAIASKKEREIVRKTFAIVEGR